MSEQIEKRMEEFNDNQKSIFNKIRSLLVGLSYKQSEQVLFTLFESVKTDSIVNEPIIAEQN
jgi:hypothetical protein